MHYMGFAEIWIDWMMTLYKDAIASVILNSAPRATFKLQRSVRQRCPLTPYLYPLIADVLGHMLKDPACGI
jgi:hypothetical protein